MNKDKENLAFLIAGMKKEYKKEELSMILKNGNLKLTKLFLKYLQTK